MCSRLRLFKIIFLLSLMQGLTAQTIGSSAPDFTAQILDGKTVRLADFKGDVVLLDIWASWCAPCKQEMPFLIDTDRQYRKKGLVILAVNIDQKTDNVHKFISGLGTTPPFRILLDPDSGIPPLYQIKGMPTTILIDRKGIIRFRHKGFKSEKSDDLLTEIKILLDENPES